MNMILLWTRNMGPEKGSNTSSSSFRDVFLGDGSGIAYQKIHEKGNDSELVTLLRHKACVTVSCSAERLEPPTASMSARGRSSSPRPIHDGDVDMENGNRDARKKADAKVVVVANLTRNVAESHLRVVFGFYGEITKLDLPLFGKSLQNRGKAFIEYADSVSAHQAVSHMDGGQLDGAVLRVELSEIPLRPRSRSPRRRSPPRMRDRPKSISRSRSRSRSRSPPPRGGPYRRRGFEPRYEPRRGRPFGRRGPPITDTYRPRSRTRSWSPIRRAPDRDRVAPRRRSPSYERGGNGRGARHSKSKSGSRSRSYSVRSSRSRRSRTRSLSRSRSRTRSRSYSSYSRYSRSRSRSRSFSRGRRSYSRDDIRDSRSRSPRDT